MQGASLDLTGMALTGTWSDGTGGPLPLDGVDISGFDPTKIGTQDLRVVNGVISDNGFTVTVIERGESRLFFDHGLTSAYEPSPYQYYTVPQGRTVVLAPVQQLIPDNAVYEWKVDGVVQIGYDTEYFPYTGTTSSGTHTIMVTAKVEGVAIASVSTDVVCVGGAAKRPNVGSNAAAKKLYSVVAPGQFGSTSPRLSGLNGFGGFGGYAVFEFDHSVEKTGFNGEEILIGGNAFTNWEEPGAIWVSQDDNGNGLPDDTWYELKGSHTLAPETYRRYAVTFRDDYTWLDNLGSGGNYLPIQKWPSEAPAGVTEMTLVGTRLDFPLTPPLWGYADVMDNGRVSLSNAIQADGSPVDLPFIDFVKVVTALHYADSTFGERSTEAVTPRDRFMPDPDKLIDGKDLEDGTYEYTFKNNSGYALTIEFDGTEFSLGVGATIVKTSENAVEHIDFYGGNAYLSKPAVGQVVFVAGPDS
jgi:hypothetical protein